MQENRPISRNTPCPCGSGRKYKQCCGRLADTGTGQVDVQQGVKADAGSSVAPAFNARQRYAEAKRLYLSGKYATAKEQFETILEQDPEDARTLMGLGLCLFQLGQFERGLEQAERAYDIRPDDLQSINDLVVTLFNLGRVEESLGWAKRAIKLGPEGARTNVMVANCYEKLHRIDEALEANALAQAANPGITYLAVSYTHLTLPTTPY